VGQSFFSICFKFKRDCQPYQEYCSTPIDTPGDNQSESLSNLIKIIHRNLIHLQRLTTLLCLIWILKDFILENIYLISKFKRYGPIMSNNRRIKRALPGTLPRRPLPRSKTIFSKNPRIVTR
jgi:hypothetical protein